MATTNPVSQVLVTSGDQAPLAKDNPISALAVGQIGVFNYQTGLSVDATSPVGNTRDIFIAVGIDPDGVGSLQDINKSAGQVLQVRNAKALTVGGYLDAAPKIVDVYGFVAKCVTEYGFKVELRNAEIYGIHGYNQFAKTFLYKTGCCDDQCIECGDGDPIELVKGLYNQVVADPDGLLLAQYIKNEIKATVTAGAGADGDLTVTIGTSVYTVSVANGDTAAIVAGKIVAAVNAQAGSPYTGVATAAVMDFFLKSEGTGTFALTSAGGTGVTVGSIVAQTKTVVADPDAFKVSYPGAILGLRITSVPAKVHTFCSINLKYYKMRETNIIVSLIEGFACNGTATTVQELQYSQGKGYDIQELEYLAGGLNGKPGPYRVSALTGTAREGFQYFASKSVNYNTIALAYDQFSVGGWLQYLNNLETVIAIPCADSTTLTELAAIFDAIFTQFGAISDDVAAMDCTNVTVATVDDPDADGIESLS